MQRLTLDRPEKRNALDSASCRELVAGLRAADDDPDVDVVVLDAEGKTFCAGMDLAEALEPDAAERNQIHVDLFTAGYWMTKPLIACVQGPAVAGGVGVVANAHVVVADEAAWFLLPEARIGMWPFVIWRPLVDAMGERRARELTLTCRKFSAAEAREYGLVHFLAPAGQSQAVTAKYVEEMVAIAGGSGIFRTGLRTAAETRGLGWAEAAATSAARRAAQFRDAHFRDAAANILRGS